MIEQREQTTILRFFPKGAKPFDEYEAIVTVTWLSGECIFLSGLKGNVSRHNWRELCLWFSSNGVTKVLAQRSPKHTLPYCTDIGHGLFSIDVEKLIKRFVKQ